MFFVRLMSLGLLVISSQLPAAVEAKPGSHEVEVSESPGLKMSEGISNKIYQQSTRRISSQTTGTTTIDSAVRIFMPSEFQLENQYFRVPYRENTGSLVGFMVGPSIPVAAFDAIQLNSFAHLGYAYAQGIYDAQSDTGLMVKDQIELQWIPVQAGIELSSRSFSSQRITLGITSSAGIDWYTQNGKLDGMNQTYWVPRYEIGANTTLFSLLRRGEGGFDGVKISVVAYRSFLSRQIHRGLAGDVGARYAF